LELFLKFNLSAIRWRTLCRFRGPLFPSRKITIRCLEEDVMSAKKVSPTVFAAIAVASLTFTLAVRAQAQTETVLFSNFIGVNGSNPFSTPIFDSTGHLYGTAEVGGNRADCGGSGCGVVFKATRSTATAWRETVIHAFSGGRDGSSPQAGLVQDAAGNLYGTTPYGGGPCTFNSSLTCGVIFELSLGADGGWKETVLHVFTGGLDGGNPSGSIILDSVGNLYGVTHDGGSAPSCATNGTTGCGVVYKLAPLTGGGWKQTVLYSFFNAADGAYPSGTLTLDAQGNLYGANAPGFGSGGAGVIYELSPSPTTPWPLTVVHGFGNNGDGEAPNGGLVFDSAGNLYGTTSQGVSGYGIVFELSPSGDSWTENILLTFDGAARGGIPVSGVILDSAGNLYGTTSVGGPPEQQRFGLVYKLSSGAGGAWTETILHNFGGDDSGDGQTPYGGLVFDTAGNLYGTTVYGGGFLEGTLYKIVP
jgi:hypothetical protein